MTHFMNSENELWDFIIVGSGMGGATIGYQLAKAGKKVLFIEKGLSFIDNKFQSCQQTNNEFYDYSRLQSGFWPSKITKVSDSNQVHFFPSLGCGSGGSTLLYAAQLERFHETDFNTAIPSKNSIGDLEYVKWPITFTDFLPFYRQAEILYKVCGTSDPLNPDSSESLLEPPALSLFDDYFYNLLQSLRLNPYRCHLAVNYSQKNCNGCGGIICVHGCKNDSLKICLQPAVKIYGATLLSQCEVIKLESISEYVTHVTANLGGKTLKLRAKYFILAAGALNTPKILLNSKSSYWPNGIGNNNDLVGRFLMWHASDFFAFFKFSKLSRLGPLKAFSLNDFYNVEGIKLGTIQSVGAPINYYNINNFLSKKIDQLPVLFRILFPTFLLNFISFTASKLLNNISLLATIVEDYPNFNNRVYYKNDAINFEYHYSEDLKKRTKLLFNLIKNALSNYFLIIKITSSNNLNYGHACGTCRFGTDPANSVLDMNNKVHGSENLYVVDSSFFPSSAGTNPSLTVAANAIRVATHLLNNEFKQDNS